MLLLGLSPSLHCDSASPALGAETVIDAAQQVVGLEDEQQLARHLVQDGGDLWQVPTHLLLDGTLL